MTFPQQAQLALAEAGTDDLPGVLATDEACQGAKFHSPTPLVVHEVALAPSGQGPTAWLCATCRDNLRVLQHLLVATEGQLRWAVRREFGNLIRALAVTGWQADHPDTDADEVVDPGA